MAFKSLPLLFCFLFFSCQKITNNINQVEFECGGTAELGEYRYVKLFSEGGALNSSEGVQVRDVQGQDYSALVTPKGCLKIPRQLEDRLVVSRPAATEGLVLYPQRIGSGSVQSYIVKSHRYKALQSECNNAIATRAAHMDWPINLSGVDSAAYEWQLVVKSKDDVLISMKRVAFEDLSRDWVDLSGLDDGVYEMMILGRQIFSKDKLETRFQCPLVIDREMPVVTLDREMIRVDDEAEASIQAAPGEAIRIQTAGTVSVDTIYACLRPETTRANSCRYDALTSGYVTAPQKGSWILSLYAKDAAGNVGPVEERKLQVFDSNLVGTIRAYVEQSALAQKSGAFLQSLIFGVKAYEKMKALGSKAEILSVASSVRKSILESISMPIEELIVKMPQNQITLSIGIVQSGDQPLYIVGNGWHTLDYIQMNGQKKLTVDLSEVLGIPKSKVSYRYCEAAQTVVANGGKVVALLKDGIVSAQFTMPDALESSMISVSQDCQFAILEKVSQDNRRRLLMDLSNGKTFDALEGYYAIGLLNSTDRSQVIVESLNKVSLLMNLTSGTARKLSESLGITEISQVQKAGDQSTGILTQDQTFHIVGKDGQLVSKIANASSFQTGQVKDEYVVFTDAFNVRIVNSQGLQKSMVSVGPSAWSYLSANQEFLVGMSAGSNVVKIWTREGNNYDEIYNKGDSIRKVLLSEDGYLLVESAFYQKIFRLKNEVARKQAPRLVHAVGLQFSPDGQSLYYKEQRPMFVDGQNTVQNNLVHWSLKDDRTSVYELAQPTLSSQGYPGYGSQTRDLEYFSQNGTDYVAVTVKRGTVAIYDANRLDTPIETHDFFRNWLLDIAVDPSGDLLAAASQSGLVFVIGRKNGQYGATSLNDVHSQYFEEYPVTLNFDRTGKYLFVTDLNRNVMKYSISFREDSQSYALTLEATVSEAGVNLAINAKGDMLALVGQGGKLKTYDTDLKLLKEYDLSPSSITLGQAVTFSPDGSKIYAGVYDGTWNELDLKTGQLLKVRFSSNETGATNLIVSPQGDQLAFMGGGFVQIADLNVDRVYKKMCAWLAPRLPYIPDLADEDRRLCSAP